MRRILLSFFLLLFAGCATQLPPTPEDIQAKRFETLPDKGVIYIARQRLDSNEGATLMLDNRMTITTFRGTYYRWEVAPGTHRISGFASGTELVTLNVAPGKLYFIQHTVLSDPEDKVVILTALQQVSEERGRTLVQLGELLR